MKNTKQKSALCRERIFVLAAGEGFEPSARGAESAIEKYVRVRIPPHTDKEKTARPGWDRLFLGSGRRIRTLTYGVRVRCATFTQSR